MSTVHIQEKCKFIIPMMLIYGILLITPGAAIGEASTSLYVYVPPGESSGGCGGGCCGGYHDSNSATYIIVTATQDNTVVDIIDLDTTIGDPTDNSYVYPVVDGSDVDISEYDVHLDMGQSRLIKVSYNGDSGLPDSDGTYFHVSATKPVTVYTGTAVGKSQADFVPSNQGTMVGNSFFVYLPDCYENEYDLAVFAYEDNTTVSVYNISSNQTLVKMNDKSKLNATTSVDFSSAVLIANKTLFPITPSTGHPPVLYRQAINGNGIEAGYTYMITADKNISVASVGTLNDNNDDDRGAGDEAYFVPGISDNPYHFGTGLAHTFYMQLNSEYNDHCGHKGYENEIYLINYNSTDTAYVTIEEFNPSTYTWEQILGEDGNPDGKFNVSNSNILYTKTSSQGVSFHHPIFQYQGLVRITSNDVSGNPMDISVFAGVSFKQKCGCSKQDRISGDVAAFSSGDTGYGGSKETILYIPPPVYQTSFNEEYTHVYIYILHNNTNLTIQSWNETLNKWDTENNIEYTNIIKDQIIDYRINPERYNNGQDKLRILSSERTTVQVSNWKNNWASYVPGGTSPEFSVKLSIQNRYLTINTIPAQRIGYSFDVTNGAIGNIGSELYDLYVINTIPDGINQNNIYWSVCSTAGIIYDPFSVNLVSNQSPIDTDKGIEYTWENVSDNIKVTVYAYNNGSGTVFTFNKGVIQKDETLTFTLCTLLNETYYDGTPIRSGPMVVDVSAEAENPFLGDMLIHFKPSGTIILSYLTPGIIQLY
jgi:hypothetical protein